MTNDNPITDEAPSIAGPRRVALPINSHGLKLEPHTLRTLRAPCRNPFMPLRLFVSPPMYEDGTFGTHDNWEIFDIRVDGQSVRVHPDGEPISGDAFVSAEHAQIDNLIKWRECTRDIEIDVRYIGEVVGGARFYSGVLGHQERDAR
jgi:hypothetical protein